MARPDTSSERPHPRGAAQSPTTVAHDLGVIQRWRERSAQRKLARLLRPRSRGALARQLRRTAWEANARPRIRPGPEVLLHYRAAAVRTELLEIAALLEQAHDPDPTSVREIHELLANGDSPLYHAGVHVSELYATLYYIRAGLLRAHAYQLAATPRLTDESGLQPGRPDTDPAQTTKR